MVVKVYNVKPDLLFLLSPFKPSWLLAGVAGGRLNPNSHVPYERDTSLQLPVCVSKPLQRVVGSLIGDEAHSEKTNDTGATASAMVRETSIDGYGLVPLEFAGTLGEERHRKHQSVLQEPRQAHMLSVQPAVSRAFIDRPFRVERTALAELTFAPDCRIPHTPTAWATAPSDSSSREWGRVDTQSQHLLAEPSLGLLEADIAKPPPSSDGRERERFPHLEISTSNGLSGGSTGSPGLQTQAEVGLDLVQIRVTTSPLASGALSPVISPDSHGCVSRARGVASPPSNAKVTTRLPLSSLAGKGKNRDGGWLFDALGNPPWREKMRDPVGRRSGGTVLSPIRDGHWEEPKTDMRQPLWGEEYAEGEAFGSWHEAATGNEAEELDNRRQRQFSTQLYDTRGSAESTAGLNAAVHTDEERQPANLFGWTYYPSAASTSAGGKPGLMGSQLGHPQTHTPVSDCTSEVGLTTTRSNKPDCVMTTGMATV